MAMDMVRMPPEVSVGFSRVKSWGTSVVRLGAGQNTERVRNREQPARMWHAVKGPFTKALVEEADGFFDARFGGFHAFRFWDPTDFTTNPTGRTLTPGSQDQLLGYGDGVRTRFPLRRVYKSSPNDLVQRLFPEDRMLPIHGETDDRLARKIGLAPGTVFNTLVAANAAPVTVFSIDWQDRELVIPTPPAVDAAITMGCYYDWPVVLAEESDAGFEITAESWNAQVAPNIQLELVPLERFAPETDDPGGAKSLAWVTGAPLLQKVEAKLWLLAPGASSLSCFLEQPTMFNTGGPHFVLNNTNGGAFSVAVKDELTATTIVTLTNGQTGHFFIEETGGVRNWYVVVT